MKLSTPLDQQRLSSHFQYSAWKYLLVIIAGVFMWDLVYSVTAYRAPQDKRIDIYSQSVMASQEQMQSYLDALKEVAAPRAEVVTIAGLLGNSENDVYSAQQITTYLMAGEGDLYFLGGDDFRRYAAQGVFMDLAPFVLDGTLNVQGIRLTSGMIAIQEYNETSEKMVPVSAQRLFGIPAAELAGFAAGLGIDNRDLFLCVTTFNQNEDDVIAFLDALIQQTRQDDTQAAEVMP